MGGFTTVPIVYRVEQPNSPQGLWYNNGRLDPIVTELGLGCSTLPMDPDPYYSHNEQQWFSGCGELTDLLTWFKPKELLLLEKLGFQLNKWYTPAVEDYAGHQIFLKQGATYERYSVRELL